MNNILNFLNNIGRVRDTRWRLTDAIFLYWEEYSSHLSLNSLKKHHIWMNAANILCFRFFSYVLRMKKTEGTLARWSRRNREKFYKRVKNATQGFTTCTRVGAENLGRLLCELLNCLELKIILSGSLIFFTDRMEIEAVTASIKTNKTASSDDLGTQLFKEVRWFGIHELNVNQDELYHAMSWLSIPAKHIHLILKKTPPRSSIPPETTDRATRCRPPFSVLEKIVQNSWVNTAGAVFYKSTISPRKSNGE